MKNWLLPVGTSFGIVGAIVLVVSLVSSAPVTPKVSGTEFTIESRFPGFTVYRTRVPGGWLYVTDRHSHSLATTFVPDPWMAK